MRKGTKTIPTISLYGYTQSPLHESYIHNVFELPKSLQTLIERQQVCLILFDEVLIHNQYLWVSMREDDRFQSFFEAVENYNKKIVIIAPKKTVKFLQKDFLYNGFSVKEYGLEKLHNSKHCQLSLFGDQVIVTEIETACLN